VILLLQILKNKLFGAASPSNSNQPFPGPVGNERRKLAKAKKSQTVKFKRKVKPYFDVRKKSWSSPFAGRAGASPPLQVRFFHRWKKYITPQASYL
jgi:hypothetical protein